MKTTKTNHPNGQSHDHGGGDDDGGDIGGEPRAASHDSIKPNAVSYLKSVKQIFQNQTEKYDMFLAIMKDFKAKTIDIDNLRERVKELFKGHSYLISGFNAFLPEGYEITPDEVGTTPKKVVDREEALDFVRRTMERLQNDDNASRSFWDTLKMFSKGRKDVTEVYMEASSVLGNHPDLFEEFTRFLPNDFPTPYIRHAPYGQSLAQCSNEQSSTTATKQQLQLDKKLPSLQQHRRQDKLVTSHEHNLSIHSSKLDDGREMIKEHKKQAEESWDRRVHDWNEREPDLSNDRSLKCVPDKEKAEAFSLTTDFPSYDDKDTLKGMYDQPFSFLTKVKERLGSSDDHRTFLKCLHMFSSGSIDRNDLNDLAVSLLGKHPDLMDEFNDFVDQCENIDGFLANVISKKSFDNDGQLFRSSKLEDKDRYQKREVHVSKERKENDEKYMGKSIHELDLSDCQHNNPSYRCLPEDYPIAIPSRRSKLDAEVLNDRWVSVTSGSEDYSFKHMPRNPHEKILFKCEDDQFELDLLINRARSTAKRTEELYNCITENKINIEGPFPIEEYFSVLHLRCIERLYGDYGVEAIEALRQNPMVALPVMLSRLKQKRKEWRKCRSEFNKVWAEVYAKNFYKSLDYRSFHFKLQDSKNLSPKSLVTEIKEIKEKQQKRDFLQAIAAGNKLCPIPNMQFGYSDVGIHGDLYKLVCYACKEIVPSKGLLTKVLRVWTTFLEPMFGVPSRYDKAKSAGGDRPCKDYDVMEKGLKNVDCNAKVSDFSKQFAYDAQDDHDSVAKSQSDNVSSVEHCDMATPSPLDNDVLIQSKNQEFAGHCQIEKEEGELSPSLNGDSEVDNCVGNGDANVQVTCSSELDARSKYQSRNGEGECPLEVGIHNDAQFSADGSLLERSFSLVKPLTKYVSPVLLEERRESRVIYGNDDFYVLFRLHRILYERILSAKTHLMNVEMKRRIAKDAYSPDPYSRFMSALYNLLGGSIDDAKFEDECQAVIGKDSYMFFTMDKLIHKLVKQLQVVASLEINNKLLQLFEYENSQKPNRLTHSAYLANACVILPEENIYRLECSSDPSKLFIWLVDNTNETPPGFTLDPNCADYLYNDFLSVFPVEEEPHGFMLQRNKRKHGDSDDFPDMEGVRMINKLDHILDCNSAKIKYAAHTEDVFYRPRKKRKTWAEYNRGRVERFHRFLSNCEGTSPTSTGELLQGCEV